MLEDAAGEEDLIPHHHNTSVWSKYDKGRQLGSGNFGNVFLGINKVLTCPAVNLSTQQDTREEVAIKLLKQTRISAASAKKEISVHAKATVHQNSTTEDTRLMRLHEVFMNKPTNETALVMDLARGGDLFDRVARAPYSEENACKLLVLLVESVIKLHSIGIAHRDLKLENILLRQENHDFDFCIADLGGAKWFPGGARAITSTETGTLGYTAPEAVATKREKLQYDAYQVDVFSLGVILYIILCGYPPWDLHTPPSRRPKRIAFETSHPASQRWTSISAEAKVFGVTQQ
jgi:serine/threonine protein kinase